MGLKITYTPKEMADLIRKDLLSQGLEPVGKIELSASMGWTGYGQGERQEPQVDEVEVTVRPVAQAPRGFTPSASQIDGAGESQAEYFGHKQ